MLGGISAYPSDRPAGAEGSSCRKSDNYNQRNVNGLGCPPGLPPPAAKNEFGAVTPLLFFPHEFRLVLISGDITSNPLRSQQGVVVCAKLVVLIFYFPAIIKTSKSRSIRLRKIAAIMTMTAFIFASFLRARRSDCTDSSGGLINRPSH